MNEQPTKQEMENLAERIRAELARTPDLGFIKVAQVVDNPVSTEHPRGWSVQLLNDRTHGYPAYVSSLAEWETLRMRFLIQALA
jgi:hypothetical protein